MFAEKLKNSFLATTMNWQQADPEALALSPGEVKGFSCCAAEAQPGGSLI